MGGKALKKAVTAAFAPAVLATDLASKAAKPIVKPITDSVMKSAMGVAGLATPDAPAIELPPSIDAQPVQEDDAETLEENTAAEIVRKRKVGGTQRTLLSSGLGGGQATVGRATLLGGG